MNLRDLIDLLAEQPTVFYRNALVTALVGPLLLRLFGLTAFSRWIRPVALLIIFAGMYAKQRTFDDTTE
jgi:hypothetical protein